MSMKIEIALLDTSSFAQLEEAMSAAYPTWSGSLWRKQTIENLIRLFPEGQLAVKVNDILVGAALSIIVESDFCNETHTYNDIVSNYTFKMHQISGDVLYGIEIFIAPEYRNLRLGRRLYDARKELCEKLNLKSIVFGGRIPNYSKYANQYSPKQYIQKVKYKEIFDPVLSFQLSNDFHVKKILKGYMPEDSESKEYATLLQWDNVLFVDPLTNKINKHRIRNIRLGLIQWQVRPFKSIEDLYDQAEYFIETISRYKSDFAIFPEYFNGPLLCQFGNLMEAQALRAIAEFSPSIRKKFQEFAIKYNVNIVVGSMPCLEGDLLKNIGYLCHRNGHIDQYEKLHITAGEIKYWGLRIGKYNNVFETDVAKVGILICYDIEFPELGRLLADAGAQIIMVPYLTDTQNAYMRVRTCARARSIENECFVAITGCVGNLPNVKNLDIHYSQSAVFTPCDFSFPFNGIKSEATANTEMILITDVDLRLLDELHNYGSVQNLKDRRKDIYNVFNVSN